MKKLYTLLLAISVLTASVSCSSGSASPSDSSTSAPAESILPGFKEADVTIARDMSSILRIDRSGDHVLVFGENGSGSFIGSVTDRSFTDHTDITFTPKEGETVISACIDKFGKTAVLTDIEGSTMIYLFNDKGEPFKEQEFGDISLNKDKGAILFSTAEGYILNICNEALAVISSSLEYLGEVDVKGDRIHGLAVDSDNIPRVILQRGDEYFTAAIEGTDVGEDQKCSSLSSSPYTVCGGEEYPLIGNFPDGMYGLSDGTWVKLTDYMDNTFSSSDVTGFVSLGENEFAAVIISGGKYRLTLLSERDISEVRSKTNLTAAAIKHSPTLEDIVKDFNAKSTEYHVDIKVYGSSADDWDATYKNFTEDILSGDPPDIIQNNFMFSPETFGARDSLFVDLYELIDKDDKLSRSDFLEGYLEASDHNSRLYSISPGFIVNTMTVKDKYLGGLTHWDTAQMLDVITSRPEGMGIIPYSEDFLRSDMTLGLINMGGLVDYEKAECHFDSPEFISVIQTIQEHELGLTVSQFEALSEGEGVFFHEGTGIAPLHFRNDYYLINNDAYFTFAGLQETVHGAFNEPCTLIGYPDDFAAGTTSAPEGSLTFSIMRSCNDIDGAWAFLRDSLFSEDAYNGWHTQAMFPVIEKYFDERLEKEKEPTMTDLGTGTPENTDFYFLDENFEEKEYYEPFSNEEAEKYGALIREAAKHPRKHDEVIYGILREELDAYFEGERSAEKTAEIIQNRVSIYLSEHYS